MGTARREPFETRRRFRFAAVSMLALANFAVAVLAGMTVYIGLSVWHHMEEPYLWVNSSPSPLTSSVTG